MRLYGHNDALPNININNLLVMSVHNGTSLDQKFRQRFSRKPTGGNNKPQNLNPRRHPQQPSVVEIKHAISAGRFCDADHKHLEEVKNMKFNVTMMNFPWVFEYPLQKKI
ncbi:hypothetical protein F8388_000123 [Cannabis sativa]|uniref:Uncharacterized protein n=1 Tax=Cannabis sativa TaxID=3483 RepID=A0A7J6FML5_CANSA|nr:hypothetical protein F8388_000123 [Cannabis sativa]